MVGVVRGLLTGEPSAPFTSGKGPYGWGGGGGGVQRRHTWVDRLKNRHSMIVHCVDGDSLPPRGSTRVLGEPGTS